MKTVPKSKAVHFFFPSTLSLSTRRFCDRVCRILFSTFHNLILHLSLILQCWVQRSNFTCCCLKLSSLTHSLTGSLKPVSSNCNPDLFSRSAAVVCNSNSKSGQRKWRRWERRRWRHECCRTCSGQPKSVSSSCPDDSLVSLWFEHMRFTLNAEGECVANILLIFQLCSDFLIKQVLMFFSLWAPQWLIKLTFYVYFKVNRCINLWVEKHFPRRWAILIHLVERLWPSKVAYSTSVILFYCAKFGFFFHFNKLWTSIEISRRRRPRI